MQAGIREYTEEYRRTIDRKKKKKKKKKRENKGRVSTEEGPPEISYGVTV